MKLNGHKFSLSENKIKLASSFFYILTKESIPKNMKHVFLSHLISFYFQDIQFFVVFFLSFQQFRDLKRQMKLERNYDVVNWLA